jgi:hypothetical protein
VVKRTYGAARPTVIDHAARVLRILMDVPPEQRADVLAAAADALRLSPDLRDGAALPREK